MNIEIANRLIRLRKEKGFSQEELAARLGISRQAVSKWERAESSPDTDNLILLARLYGVSLDALLMTDATDDEIRAETSGAAEGTLTQKDGSVPEGEKGVSSGSSLPAENLPDLRNGSPEDASAGVPREDEFPDDDVFPDGDPCNEGDVPRKNRELLPSSLTGFVAVLAVVIYLLLGFGWSLWHPGWIVFLLVPLYACAASGNLFASISNLTVILYLVLGSVWGLWHPGWLVFFLIPLAATFEYRK